jgi:hypothetical protein
VHQTPGDPAARDLCLWQKINRRPPTVAAPRSITESNGGLEPVQITSNSRRPVRRLFLALAASHNAKLFFRIGAELLPSAATFRLASLHPGFSFNTVSVSTRFQSNTALSR